MFDEFRPVPKPNHQRSKPKQKDIPQDIRRFVKDRDRHQCVRCGAPAHHLHHLITKGRYDPRLYNFKGGVHDPRNLCCVCGPCHTLIHDQPEVMKEMLRWQKIKFGEVRIFKEEEEE